MSDSSKNANEEVVKPSKRVFEKGLHISFDPRHTGIIVHTVAGTRRRGADPAKYLGSITEKVPAHILNRR